MQASPPPGDTETPNKDRRLKFEEFEGESIEAAIENARAALGDRLLGTDTVRKVLEKSATARARTAEEALKDVGKRIPADAFDRTEPKITQDGQSGQLEVHEKSEEEARQAARSEAPDGARLDKIECTKEPTGGMLGFGKKPGTWVVQWSTPFVAELTYKMPAMVAARYYE